MLGNENIPFEYTRVRMKVGQKTTLTSHPHQVTSNTPGVTHPNPFDFIPVQNPTFPNPTWAVSDVLILDLSNMVNQSADVEALDIGSAYVICTIQGVESRTLVEVFAADAPDYVIVKSTVPA